MLEIDYLEPVVSTFFQTILIMKLFFAILYHLPHKLDPSK